MHEMMHQADGDLVSWGDWNENNNNNINMSMN